MRSVKRVRAFHGPCPGALPRRGLSIRPNPRTLGVFAAALLAAGCTPGPKFVRPASPAVQGYLPSSERSGAPVTKAGPPVQHIERGVAPPDRWWGLFHCKRLDSLVKMAVQHSPTVAAAQANLAQAKAAMRASEAVFYPQVGGDMQVARQRVPGSAFGGNFPTRTYTLHTATVDVGYYPDLFGLNRLVYRASSAAVDVQRYRMQATYLSLESQVVSTALQQASLREQIRATHTIITSEQKMLRVAQVRYKAGETTRLDLLSQQTQLNATEATLPALEQALDTATNSLAVLAGRYPANWAQAPLTLSEVRLPLKLPVSLPSALVRQRPDIRAAVATLRQSNALVGEAVAERYPTFELTAQFGSEASTMGTLFSVQSEMWKLVGDLTLPVFDGGKLAAQEQQARAAYRVALAEYTSSVLGAFQQVADALRAVQHDGDALSAEQRSYEAAGQALDVLRAQYRAGAVDYLNLLTGQVQYNQARIAYVKARAQRYIDTAALFDALGGGWWPAHRAGQQSQVSHRASDSPKA